MAETDVRDYRFEQPRNLEAAAAWIVVFAVVIDVVFLGFVAWNAWTVEKESRRVFALLDASAQACHATLEASVPVRYDNARWKTSFELPGGHFAAESVVSDDDAVEVRVSRRPDAEALASTNALYDTTVRVRIGPSTGFSRYYAKPYTEY